MIDVNQEDPTKMIMSQIPRFMRESDVKTLVEKFGSINELNIVRDKRTGESRGYCFITFSNRSSAQAAHEALHLKINLPTMNRPIEMKFADANERKLFVGMLSRNLEEKDIRELFMPYGAIEQCLVLRDTNGRSKGCAFVTFESKLAALNAIKFMHRSILMENCTHPINVRFADSSNQRHNRPYANSHNYNRNFNQTNSSFVNMSTTLNSSLLFRQLIQNLNRVNSIEEDFHTINQQFACGDSNQILQHSAAPNLNRVNWVDNSNQNQYCGYDLTIAKPQNNISNRQIIGPDGSNLFIYQLPVEFNDLALAQLFSFFGTVLSAKVFIDKVTNKSKCFGFISYDNPNSAQTALNAMNGFLIGNKMLKVKLKEQKIINYF